MLKICILSLWVGCCVASHLPHLQSYYRSSVNAFANPESLDNAVRIQSAVKVTEVALAGNRGCLKKALCALGTLPRENIPRMSVAKGADNFLGVLQRMVTVSSMAGLPEEDLPNVRQILASNSVGRSSGDLTMCEGLFPCEISARDLRDDALMIRDSDHQFKNSFIDTLMAQPSKKNTKKESRTMCQTSGSLCPGISIGCALCGVFAPGTCGDTCIIAALYCGTSGYACQMEAYVNSNQMAEKVPEAPLDVEEPPMTTTPEPISTTPEL